MFRAIQWRLWRRAFFVQLALLPTIVCTYAFTISTSAKPSRVPYPFISNHSIHPHAILHPASTRRRRKFSKHFLPFTRLIGNPQSSSFPLKLIYTLPGTPPSKAGWCIKSSATLPFECLRFQCRSAFSSRYRSGLGTSSTKSASSECSPIGLSRPNATADFAVSDWVDRIESNWRTDIGCRYEFLDCHCFDLPRISGREGSKYPSIIFHQKYFTYHCILSELLGCNQRLIRTRQPSLEAFRTRLIRLT